MTQQWTSGWKSNRETWSITENPSNDNGGSQTRRQHRTASGKSKLKKEYQTERINIIYAIIDAWTSAMKGDAKPDVNEAFEKWMKLNQKYTEQKKRG